MGRLQVVPEGALYTSVSQIRTWLMCPRKFELRYIRGVPPAFVPVALAFGTAFHAAVARFYSGIQSQGSPPPKELIEQTFRDSWQAQLDGKVPVQSDDEDDPADIIDLGMRMLAAFYTHAAGKVVQVEAIEHAFAVGLHDPNTGEVLEELLVGVFDLVLREGERRVIVELKTAAKKYSQDQFDFDLQPSGYKLAAGGLGWGEAGVRYLVVTKTKAPAVQEEALLRGPLAEDDFLRTTVGVLRAIDVGVAHPVRGWQCRSCPFRTPCETLKDRP